MRSRAGALLLIMLAAPVGHAQAPPSPSGTAAISGRILDSGSRPIPNATILLGLLNERLFPQTWWTTTSDENGSYQFTGLAGGRYSLMAAKEGYVGWRSIPTAAPAPLVVGNPVPALALSPSIPSMIIDLVPAGHAAERNVTLKRPGRISGRILSPDGQPMPGESLRMYRVDSTGLVSAFASIRADFTGRFVFADAEPGEYRLGVADAVPNRVRPEEIDISSLRAVSIEEGSDIANVDVIASAAEAFSITGRVVDTLGLVPRSIQIEYGVPGEQHRGLLTSSLVNLGIGSMLSPDGRFRIRDREIRPGQLAIMVRGENDDGAVIGLVTVTTFEGPNEVEVMVGKPGAIRGRLTMNGGAPVTGVGARLALVREGFTPLGAADDVVEPSPDGWIEADNLIGTYRVRIDAPAMWTVNAVRRRGIRLPNDRLVIRNAETLDDLEIIVGPR